MGSSLHLPGPWGSARTDRGTIHDFVTLPENRSSHFARGLAERQPGDKTLALEEPACSFKKTSGSSWTHASCVPM